MDAPERRRSDRLEQENDALRRAVMLLHRIANLVRESLELEPTCYAVLTGVTAGVGLGLNRAMLFLADSSDREVVRGVGAVGPADPEEANRVWKAIEAEAPDLETLYQAGLRERARPSALDRRVRELEVPVSGDSPIALAMRRGGLVHGEGSDDLGNLLDLETAVAAPLRGRHGTKGVLYADNPYTRQTLDSGTELVLSMVADHAGRAIESAHHYEQVAREARTDAVTGLGHHGAMMEAVRRAVAAAQTNTQPLGLAMLDLDQFKSINDTLGHLSGDALLVGVAARLRSAVRTGETPFRYGGDEFAVLLPDVEPSELEHIGGRLRQALGSRPFELSGQSCTVTCSVGVASTGPEHADAQALIEAADRALRRAKVGGRNRVERELL